MKKLKKLLKLDCVINLLCAGMVTGALSFWAILISLVIWNGCTSCSPPKYGCIANHGFIGYGPGDYSNKNNVKH